MPRTTKGSSFALAAAAGVAGAAAAVVAAATVGAAAVAFTAPAGPNVLQQGVRPAPRSMLPEHPRAALPRETGAGTLLGAVSAAAGAALAGLRAWRGQRKAARRGTQRRGWGDDVVFHDASVKSNVEAAKGLRLVTLEAPPDVTDPFKRGGQFVQAKPGPDAKPSFYAISSAPTASGPMEFLIKDVESNAWITGAGSGDMLQLSPAAGKGYDLDCDAWKEADVSQVNIFATGSGVAPMRAVIESGALQGKVTRLYYGVREEAAMAYEDRFADWRKRGVEVMPVLSKPGEKWSGRQGYVQDAMASDEEEVGDGWVLVKRHGALLCGQKEMVEGVREVYKRLGVPVERTLMNF